MYDKIYRGVKLYVNAEELCIHIFLKSLRINNISVNILKKYARFAVTYETHSASSAEEVLVIVKKSTSLVSIHRREISYTISVK